MTDLKAQNESGELIDAKFDLSEESGLHKITIHSNGGAGSSQLNPDYNLLLTTIVSRLCAIGTVMQQARLESKPNLSRPAHERVLDVGEAVPLNVDTDVATLCKNIRRALAKKLSKNSMTSGGNSQRRLALLVKSDLTRTDLRNVLTRNEDSQGESRQVRERDGRVPLISDLDLTTMEKQSNYSKDLINALKHDIQSSGLTTGGADFLTVLASLLSKKFLILSGLSGSGKSLSSLIIANWMSHDGANRQAFRAGETLSYGNAEYVVEQVDRLGVVLSNRSDDGRSKDLLPHGVIEEWARVIQGEGFDKSTPTREIRERVKEISNWSPHINNSESRIRALALHLLAAESEMAESRPFRVVPVGADWTGSERMLGFPDGLDDEKYHLTPALQIVLDAADDPTRPYFLILDEMNLSHVERYFADFLSAMESGEPIPLYEGDDRRSGDTAIPSELNVPDNLFVIGTVNVDETTYMFSPKVLDRANVLEFRISKEEMAAHLTNPVKPDIALLRGKGAKYGQEFVEWAKREVRLSEGIDDKFKQVMDELFTMLSRHGAEFGFRTATEASRFVFYYGEFRQGAVRGTDWFDDAIDAVIVQKVLPRLNGSRSKLAPLLKDLWDFATQEQGGEPNVDELRNARYPRTVSKIARMWRSLNESGFASFAEA